VSQQENKIFYLLSWIPA